MGINVANADLKKFDLIKELETARANLKEKNSDIKKFLEWRSESSREDEFQLVKSIQSKKRERKMRKDYTRKGIEKDAQPLDEQSYMKGGVSRASHRYNLRKVTVGNKNI
jgi:hypothetical protein